MFDLVKNVNHSVLKEVVSLSKDLAPLIANLRNEHRLHVVVLMVSKVMQEVREIDDAANCTLKDF
jgi:hypothetical protein